MNKPVSKQATPARSQAGRNKGKATQTQADELKLRVQVADLRLRFEKLLADLVSLQQGAGTSAQTVAFGSDGPKEKN